MSTLKRAKVVMLPTKKAENCLLISIIQGKLFYEKGYFTQEYLKEVNKKSFHLYILSDDRIKEGDWISDKDGIYQFNNTSAKKFLEIGGYKKIIATTDSSLEIEGNCSCMKPESGGCYQCNKKLPQPSQSFIEKFVERYNQGNPITEVMVEYDEIINCPENSFRKDLVIQPGVEVTKCDQCVTVYKLKVNPKDNTITIRPVKDSLKDIMNKDPELKEEFKALIRLYNFQQFDFETVDEWIEQNI